MSDGDTEFRWQNRPRDIEFENEMISRMFMYLGGDEAREAGYVVAKLNRTTDRVFLSVMNEDFKHYIFQIYMKEFILELYLALISSV